MHITKHIIIAAALAAPLHAQPPATADHPVAADASARPALVFVSATFVKLDTPELIDERDLDTLPALPADPAAKLVRDASGKLTEVHRTGRKAGAPPDTVVRDKNGDILHLLRTETLEAIPLLVLPASDGGNPETPILRALQKRQPATADKLIDIAATIADGKPKTIEHAWSRSMGGSERLSVGVNLAATPTIASKDTIHLDLAFTHTAFEGMEQIENARTRRVLKRDHRAEATVPNNSLVLFAARAGGNGESAGKAADTAKPAVKKLAYSTEADIEKLLATLSKNTEGEYEYFWLVKTSTVH